MPPPARGRAAILAAPAGLTPGSFARTAKALADPTRFQILELIAREPEISCGEIVLRFRLSQPAISHHLKLLTDAGLVTVRRAGQHGHFRLADGSAEAFAGELSRRLGLGRQRRSAPRSPARIRA